MIRSCLIVLTLLLPVAAQAQESGLRSLETVDAGRGWDAVGRLNLGGDSFCTGTLIAPDLVLTAAHCLYSKVSGVMIDLGEIEFLAGWRNGRAAAYRAVSRAIVHPNYRYDDRDKVARIGWDIALVELSQPIRLATVQPFALGSGPRIGEAVGVVSYAQNRAEAPSLQERCQVLQREARVLMFSCLADFGTSGAPIFASRGGINQIVSLVSAIAETEGRVVSLGALVDTVEELRASLDAGRGAVLAGERRGGSAGAKFLRP